MNQNKDNLIENASKGDIEAFGEIIKEYEKLIYNIAYRMFNNSEDAKDISQDVCIKIYKNIHKCKDYSTLKTWIYRITYNTCIDEIRKRKRKTTVTIDDMIETENGEIKRQLASDVLSPEEKYIQKETIQMVQDSISKLSYEHKSVIILRDINGLSYNEISSITGLSLGTVKSRIARGRESLKNIVCRFMEQKNN